MPLLFAATLFVSASLLFMIQPMVAKMVLPLLGGSPAVWNACMVFFQALLLLGYLYAHHVTGKYNPRRQWLIHVAFLGVPLVAFIAAVVFGPRHSPIAIAESLAPTGESSSPILSVLALLTVAIGIPFLVISTSAPLLQKWFEYTGHPSARDPYFLYGASNLGSMISLLGYPLFIEPHLSIVGQAWLFGLGFVVLAVMAFFCGQAAANPIGVPPPSVQNRGGKSLQKVNQQNNANANQLASTDPFPPTEAPPSLVRKVKWVTLAFIPSSLMLGVTFHISTDIASIPLIWVIPLALYLATFIIAFGNHPFATFLGAFALFGFTVMGIYFPNYFVFAVALVAVVAAGPIFGLDWGKSLWRFLSTPDHFRILIGNLAPVAILLLVFVMTSGVLSGDNSKFGLTLGLYIVTFFLAALMCHYELVRDRPSPQYLTQFYLLMSVGGVLGGIFNSLIAPLIFPQAYEFKIVLVLACLMVPVLSETADPEEDSSVASILEHVIYAIIGALLAPIVVLFEVSLAILGVGQSKTEEPRTANSASATGSETGAVAPGPRTEGMLAVMAGGLFLVISWFLLFRSELPTKYAVTLVFILFLLLARLMLKPIEQPIRKNWESIGSRQRSYMLDGAVGVLLGVVFYFLTQLPRESDAFTRMVTNLSESLPLSIEMIRVVLIYAIPVMICFFFVDRPLRFALCVAAILGYGIYQEDTSDVIYSERSFFGILKIEEQESPQRPAFRTEDGKFVVSGLITYNRLVHGTTLHGTQIREMKPNVFDMFQAINPLNPWENIAVAGANHLFDPRQEPLTYYHRTGPVGAMFRELRSRKGGADAKADFGMVGLGTGSVSCYALPGQRLTFYEIDPAVKRLVADTDKYFTYVTDARNRGAKVDIRMGDARLKLQEDKDRKYSLLLVDAFSSDSIPVHLLTKEAVQLYFDRLTPDGILALHISNRWIRLEPVVAAIVEELRKEPGFENLTARLWSDNSEKRPGKTASSWIVLAKDEQTLGTLALPVDQQSEYGTLFVRLTTIPDLQAWTDDYSDVMRVMSIKEIKAIRRFVGLPALKESDDDR